MSATAASAAPAHRSDPGEGPERPLSIVRARTRGLRVMSLVAAVLLGVVVFGSVTLHAMIVQNQSQLDQLDRRVEELTNANQQRRLDLAELEAPERVLAVATTQLGMVEPQPGTVLTLQPITRAALGVASDAAPTE